MQFWDTARRLALLSSDFPSIPSASELPQQLASDLLRLGHHESVSLQWSWQQPDSDRLDALLSSLQLGRCLMMLTLPSDNPPVNFDGSALPAGFINGTERWYGTPYLAAGVSLEQLRSIDDAGAHMDSRWKLPGGNRFIPEDVSLVAGSTDANPHLVHSADHSGGSSAKSQVWHALDNSFGSPKQVKSYLFLSCWPECSCKLHQTCEMLFFILKFTLQYSHVETFCSAPPAASALASVTASVMSKLIANNLLPQVRDQTHKFGALNSQTSEPLSPIQSTAKPKLCYKKCS